jgi:hypothetical protein
MSSSPLAAAASVAGVEPRGCRQTERSRWRALNSTGSDRVDRLHVAGLGMCVGIPDVGKEPAGTTTGAA